MGDNSIQPDWWGNGIPMQQAPKSVPIFAYCEHLADPYVDPHDDRRLTVYGAHCEDLARAKDGFHIVEWGGSYVDEDCSIPDWWFVAGSDFETVANPIMWWPLPERNVT